MLKLCSKRKRLKKYSSTFLHFHLFIDKLNLNRKRNLILYGSLSYIFLLVNRTGDAKFIKNGTTTYSTLNLKHFHIHQSCQILWYTTQSVLFCNVCQVDAGFSCRQTMRSRLRNTISVAVSHLPVFNAFQ